MKRITSILLALAMILSFCACGSNDNSSDEKKASQGSNETISSDEETNQKGTRSNPYNFNDEISITAKNPYNDYVVEYTLTLSELWGSSKIASEFSTYKIADRILVRGQVAVNCDSTDDEINFGLAATYVTASLNEESASIQTYKEGELNNTLATVYSGGTYDVMFFASNDGIALLDVSFLKISYTDSNGNNSNVWIELSEDIIEADDEVQSSPETTDAATTSELFEATSDLSVIASFVYDNDTYVVVQNTCDQAILSFSIAYINFDKNGFVKTTSNNGYERGSATAANIMPGEKYIASWYGAKGDYAAVAITSIDYENGDTWSANYVNKWAETATQNFDVDEEKSKLIDLKEIAVAAESNEYAELTDFYLNHGNRYSSKNDFNFSIKNTSTQGITHLNVFVLEFDSNGFPVTVSPYDTYCMNGHVTGGALNLEAGQSGSYTDDLFAQATTENVKVVISWIEFQDGTEWTNPYIYEWVIANNSAY
jgi:hypothetical protein